MKKKLGVLLLLCSLFSLYAEDSQPRVFLQPPAYEEGSSQLASISYTVFDTAGLILSMLGQYELQLEKDSRIEDPAAYCLENDVDRFISGNCSVNDEGGYDISLSVYDSETDRIAVRREETADTALDVFDAVDALVIPLLEELSGRQISFGALVLENRGVRGDFQFFMDGIEYSHEEDVLNRIIFGTHIVRIEQERMYGRHVVKRSSVDVIKDGISSFGFAVTGILPREEREISAIEKLIEKNWNRRSKQDAVDASFAELLVMLKDVSYSDAMASRKDKILAWQKEWEAFKYEREQASPYENRDGRMILSLGMDVLGLGVYDPDSYKEYNSGDPVDFHVKGLFFLPKLDVQYFLTDRHALLAGFALLGGDGKVSPETVANSEGEASVLGTGEGGIELTLGYEYYFNRLFVGINAEARAIDLTWDTASDSGTLEPPGGQNVLGFSLEPKVGMLLNQKGDYVYKFFVSIGSSFYSLEGEGTYFQPLDSIRVGFSAGYGGFRF